MSTAAAPAATAREGLDPVRLASWAVICLFLGIAVYGAIDTDGFLTADNFRAILSQSAYVGVFALATAIIMISGSLFSLSIGISGAICASTTLALLPQGPVVAIGATIALAVLIFAAQGFLVGVFGANPIIVTIAAGGLQQAIFLWRSKGATIVPPPGDTSLSFLIHRVDVPIIGPLPVSVYVLFGLVIVLEVMLRYTRFGRMLYLVGENRPAARAAGLPTGLIIAGAFAVAGVCIGIVGVELAAFNKSGSLLLESTFTYDAIAAAVVGGIAITGGRGLMIQALAGTLFVQTIADILLLRGESQGWQILVKGLIVLGAITLVRLNRVRSER